MWTEMINAAGRTMRHGGLDCICVGTAIQAPERRLWEIEVEDGWPSVEKQRGGCVRRAGRPCCVDVA